MTLETKLREFQFKTLNRVVFTDEKLFRFVIAKSEKLSSNPSSIYLFPEKYPQIFENTSCPG